MSRPKNTYTTGEAAKALGISVRTAQQWVERGILTAWKTEGDHRRISAKSVDQARQFKQHDTVKAPLPDRALRVLIIEDDPSLLKLYRANLSLWPFATELYMAPNGFEGLVTAGESNPHLLICDLRLPGVSGFHIVRALENMPRYKDMRIVVVSGLSEEEIRANGGFSQRITSMAKPLNFKLLQGIAESLRAAPDRI